MTQAKIIIELLDRPGEPLVFDGYEVEFTTELGLCKVGKIGSMEVRHEPNDQRRLSLKAWQGCKSYDDFRPMTSRTEVPPGLRLIGEEK
jgi:hypothetical protein